MSASIGGGGGKYGASVGNVSPNKGGYICRRQSQMRHQSKIAQCIRIS